LAFPERFFALLVTLVVEIPVNDDFWSCMHIKIGRRRYQLMMGFLPLSSAISGYCGLQASTFVPCAKTKGHGVVSAEVYFCSRGKAADALIIWR
jgi:hypothetical protein